MDTLNSALLERPQRVKRMKRVQRIEPGLVILQLEQIVTEIIGQDAAAFLDFTEDSAFILDLEMDSIKLIHFAECVNDLYGGRVNFIGWLSTKPVEEILALTVSDVVDFVEQSM
jgi:acyl carrier protein